jgi:GNAT superfamily N-acetyltransferase
MNPQTHTVHRASSREIEEAWALIKEYYAVVGVVAREDRAEFEQQYFAQGAGVWLAIVECKAVGCVALRKLPRQANCGEIKRMYVQSSYRGTGIAGSLLAALEKYALERGYDWLYLDTAASMQAAAKFYSRNSYKPCERYNSNPQAVLFMRKRVDASCTSL